MIAEKVLNTLEYPKILHMVSEYVVSPASSDAVSALRPETDFDRALRQLRLTEEACLVRYAHLENPMAAFDEAGEIFDKLDVLSTLSMGELLRVAGILRSARILRASISAINDERIVLLRELAGGVFVHHDLEKQIGDSILSDEEISDTASEKLYQIRKSIRKCNQDIKDKLGGMIRSSGVGKFLQDGIVTMRAGRYVLPVRQEYRGSVPGLVHDQSASKATVFIEPMQVVELNNNLRSLEIAERAEIEEILYRFTQSVAAVAWDLRHDYEALIEADVVFAKAAYADRIRANRPCLNADGRLKLKRARHPLIPPEKVVPVDLELGESFDALIITGPNTGGKTVCIKTAGLFCLMAATGMYLPAEEESQVGFFEEIFCDIGDEQSIENSLSTFSSHLSNITDICNRATASSLVLLDEIGAGTDPDEGAALAIAIVDYLKGIGAKLITTTHYGALKEYSIREDRVENASMEFDPDTFAPTYKLNIGMPGSSKALEIALRLGLKPEIVATAKSRLSPQKLALEQVLQKADRLAAETAKEKLELDAMRDELAEKLEAAETQRRQLEEKRDKLVSNAKNEARRIMADAADESERILSEIRALVNAPQVGGGDYLEAAKRRRQLENRMYELGREEEPNQTPPVYTEFSPSNARRGQKVFLKSLQTEGTLLDTRVKDGKLPVQMGSMKIDVAVGDLASVQQPKAKKKQPAPATNVNIKRDAAAIRVLTEINLLGQTVFEAESNVESFLEQAAYQGLTEVKIIHGIGTGKLREGVHALLRRHPLVEEFRLGKYGEGEHGVTIVKLK